MTFEAPLDEVGLRRVLSLIRSPHLTPKEAAAESREPNALASEAYYNRVCTLLNTLLSRNSAATGYEKTALWHVEFARKIAALSPTAVDPALLRWGRDVSKESVALAYSLRGEKVRLQDLEQSIRVDDTTMYNWAGAGPYGEPLGFPVWVYSDSNLDLVRASRTRRSRKRPATATPSGTCSARRRRPSPNRWNTNTTSSSSCRTDPEPAKPI